MTVVRVIIDAQRSAVLQDYAPRAFNLHRKQVSWILHPANLKSFPIKRASLNCSAVVVWHNLARPIVAADLRTFIWKTMQSRLTAGYEQVTRAAVDGDVELRIGGARTLNDGLIIAG